LASHWNLIPKAVVFLASRQGNVFSVQVPERERKRMYFQGFSPNPKPWKMSKTTLRMDLGVTQ
jgi:hypothetical protein